MQTALSMSLHSLRESDSFNFIRDGKEICILSGAWETICTSYINVFMQGKVSLYSCHVFQNWSKVMAAAISCNGFKKHQNHVTSRLNELTLQLTGRTTVLPKDTSLVLPSVVVSGWLSFTSLVLMSNKFGKCGKQIVCL